MGVIDDLQTKAENPNEEVGDDAKSAAEGEREEGQNFLSSVSGSNQDFMKRLMTEVVPGTSTRHKAATLSLWRWNPSESGDSVTLDIQPVTTDRAPIREYRFIINNAQYNKSEKFTVRSTFGDGDDVAMSFGEEPKIWRFSGVMRKGDTLGRNNWWEVMEQMYMTRLRASLLMKRNEFIQLEVGKMRMRGYLMNFSTQQNARNSDALAQFQFSMYIRSYRIGGGYSYTPASDILRSTPLKRGPSGKPAPEQVEPQSEGTIA